MRIFVSGGCKNGKSHYAQRLAKAQQAAPLYYIATMRPVDTEDDERIARHRLDRDGWGFITVEQPVDIESILRTCDRKGSFLLDSLTALLANEMFHPDGSVRENAVSEVANGLSQVISSLENIVIVSDYIYGDALLYEPLTEKYRQSLAEIDKLAAKGCDAVLEVAYSNIIIQKGGEVFSELYEAMP